MELSYNIDIACYGEVASVGSDMILYLSLVYTKGVPKIQLHTRDNEYYSKLTGSMEALEILLGKFGFVRVDSGTIANMNHYSHFEKNMFNVAYLCFENSDKKVVCSRSRYSKLVKEMDSGKRP